MASTPQRKAVAQTPVKNKTGAPVSPKSMVSGLPETNARHFFYRNGNEDRDIHMDTAKGATSGLGDVRMETARTGFQNATNLKKPAFKMWERELLESSEVKRKATVAQLCMCGLSNS